MGRIASLAVSSHDVWGTARVGRIAPLAAVGLEVRPLARAGAHRSACCVGTGRALSARVGRIALLATLGSRSVNEACLRIAGLAGSEHDGT